MANRCGNCTKSFKDDLMLYGHRVSGCKGLRQCHVCGDSFGFSPREHMVENHNDHQCSLCDRRFFLERSLEQHMEMSSHGKKGRNKKNRGKKSGVGRIKATPIKFSPEIRLSSRKRKLASAVVNHLKTTMEHNTGLNIANFYRSGSTAKGTALESSSDIDVILYCNTDQSAADFASTTKQAYLDKLQSLIDRGIFNWADDVKIKKTTQFHVGVRMTFGGQQFDVDIVLSRNSPGNMSARQQAAKYREMATQTPEILEHYSSELVRLQNDAIRRLPSAAREVIQAVKFWKQKNHIPIKSYFVELVVLHKVGEVGETVGREELLRAVVQELSHVDTMKVISWPGDTSGRVYQQSTPGPVMVDRVNPFNNVAPSAEEASIIVEALRDT